MLKSPLYVLVYMEILQWNTIIQKIYASKNVKNKTCWKNFCTVGSLWITIMYYTLQKTRREVSNIFTAMK
jgi:hypothetical protein